LLNLSLTKKIFLLFFNLIKIKKYTMSVLISNFVTIKQEIFLKNSLEKLILYWYTFMDYVVEDFNYFVSTKNTSFIALFLLA